MRFVPDRGGGDVNCLVWLLSYSLCMNITWIINRYRMIFIWYSVNFFIHYITNLSMAINTFIINVWAFTGLKLNCIWAHHDLYCITITQQQQTDHDLFCITITQQQQNITNSHNLQTQLLHFRVRTPKNQLLYKCIMRVD